MLKEQREASVTEVGREHVKYVDERCNWYKEEWERQDLVDLWGKSRFSRSANRKPFKVSRKGVPWSGL